MLVTEQVSVQEREGERGLPSTFRGREPVRSNGVSQGESLCHLPIVVTPLLPLEIHEPRLHRPCREQSRRSHILRKLLSIKTHLHTYVVKAIK